MKYNLSFWQRLELILVWPMWFFADPDKRKPWHLVMKGMERHVCKFTKPVTYHGYKFLECEHEGCNTLDPIGLE